MPRAADAAVVSELARRTFYDTFAATNDAADMALYLAGAYSIDIQTRELNDRDITTLLVEEAGTAIAYAMLRTDHVPECVTGPDPIELWRFYVDRAWHGRGVAAALMERVKALPGSAARKRCGWACGNETIAPARSMRNVVSPMPGNTYSCSAPIRRPIG